jgi:putative sporulation protein YtxC
MTKSLTIVMKNPARQCADDWIVSLEQKLLSVHKNAIDLQVTCSIYDQFSIVQLNVPEIAEVTVCSILADYMIHVMDSTVLLELIKREFQPLANPDINSVQQYCKQFLNGSKAPLSTISSLLDRRQAYVTEQVIHYFKEHPLMVVEGFVRFRLQEYVEELRVLVEVAIDECMLDRQYQEFISLLQYFVYMQESKTPSAHLIHKGGREFLILNDRFEIIELKELDATFKLEVLDKDINFEDMIVSTLIAVAPATIRIHTREPDLLIIKTISQIFEGRTVLCSYCRDCHAYLGEIGIKDHLYP